MEIILLIAGATLFIISFLIPARKEKVNGEISSLAQEEIKKLVSREMDGIRGQVDDVVEEAVGYAMEKTERSLERLSNEKIMAVNEYSDTVLKEIHKNHEEVMFLYDMLNSKHANLKNTVTQVNKTVKEVAETTKEAEDLVNNFQILSPQPKEPLRRETSSAVKSRTPKEESAAKAEPDIGFMGDTEGRNNNEKILELYRKGKSKVAIAKELGLGVGEVKLVIDLYKNFS
ncbi:MAG: DUF6115 domain-containing protein [Roseburia sp.]|nr:DUF6115 domain-containing protein [Roseburia sp.]